MWFTVEPIFSALSACQVLHPDPDDFDSDEHYEEGNTKKYIQKQSKKMLRKIFISKPSPDKRPRGQYCFFVQ